MAYDRQRAEAWIERERALAKRGIGRRQDANRISAGQTPVTKPRKVRRAQKL